MQTFHSTFYPRLTLSPLDNQHIYCILSKQRSFTSLKYKKIYNVSERWRREVNSTVSVIRSYTHMAASENFQVNTLQGNGEKEDKLSSLSRDFASVIHWVIHMHYPFLMIQQLCEGICIVIPILLKRNQRCWQGNWFAWGRLTFSK